MTKRGLWISIGMVVVGCGDVANNLGDVDAAGGATPDAPEAPTCVTSPASLRARWHGDGDAKEVTGTYDGTISGGLGFTAGRHGMAFSFDGLNDGVVADDSDALWPVGSFTQEVWMRASFAPATEFTYLFGKYDCGGADRCGASDYGLYLRRSGVPYFEIRVPGRQVVALTAANHPVLDNQWHHLVGVRDVSSKRLALYVDGALAIAVPLADADLAAMTDDGVPDPVTLGAGRRSGVDGLVEFGYVGALDDAGFYISALSDAEIAAIHAAPDGFCP